MPIVEYRDLSEAKAKETATTVIDTGAADGVTRVEVIKQDDGKYTVRIFTAPS